MPKTQAVTCPHSLYQSRADAKSFKISRKSGQLETKADLNYEDKSLYTVVVTATDPLGATDSIVVTNYVTDDDDPAEIAVKRELDR